MKTNPAFLSLTLGLCVAVCSTQAALVGHWTFNEGKGDKSADLTGEHHDAVLKSGATWEESSAGGFAVVLDGKAGAAEIQDNVLFNMASQITLEVWFKPSAVPASGQEARLFGKTYETYTFSYYGDGNVWFYINGGTNHLKTSIPVGTYTHLVATYDGKMMRLYANGKEADKKEYAEKISQNNVALMLGGALSHSQGGELNFSIPGAIDEARIYDSALKPLEVEQNYKMGPKKAK